MKLKKDLVLRSIGDQHVIVAPGQDMVDISKVFSLNETASWLWTALQELDSFSQDSIAELLYNRYELSRSQALVDAGRLVEIFKMHDMLDS